MVRNLFRFRLRQELLAPSFCAVLTRLSLSLHFAEPFPQVTVIRVNPVKLLN